MKTQKSLRQKVFATTFAATLTALVLGCSAPKQYSAEVEKGDFVYRLLEGELGREKVVDFSGNYRKMKDVVLPGKQNAYELLKKLNPEIKDLNKIYPGQRIVFRDYNKNGYLDVAR